MRLQNSVTSSKPSTSSDGLVGEQRQRGRIKSKSRRKPGGQPGHRGHWRGLAPADRVDKVINLLPDRCRHCDHRLTSGSRKVSTQGEPRRHQVTELPPIEAQAHHGVPVPERGSGPDCGKGHAGRVAARSARPFRAGVDRADRLNSDRGLPPATPRVVQEMLQQVLGIPRSVWEVSAEFLGRSQRSSGRNPAQNWKNNCPMSRVINSDETGYRTNGEKRWLLGAGGSRLCLL